MLVSRAVGMLGEQRMLQDNRIEAYKQTTLTDPVAHDLVVRALDSRVIPVTHVPDVLHEWRSPSHEEFAQGMTAWRFFNAVTEVLKGNLDALPRRTQALHGLLDQACGLHQTLSTDTGGTDTTS